MITFEAPLPPASITSEAKVGRVGHLFRIHRATIISAYNVTSASENSAHFIFHPHLYPPFHLLLPPPLQPFTRYYQHHCHPPSFATTATICPLLALTTATLCPLLPTQLPPSALYYHHHCHPPPYAFTTTAILHPVLPPLLPPSTLCYHHHCHPSHVFTTTTATFHPLLHPAILQPLLTPFVTTTDITHAPHFCFRGNGGRGASKVKI